MPFAPNNPADADTVHTFNFRMPTSMIARLHELARQEDRSTASLVRRIIELYLEAHP